MTRNICFNLVVTLTLLTVPMAVSAQDYDPCPKLVQEGQASQDDLARVQADIERYTLCVQRAILLQRLNDLALTTEEQAAPSFNIDNIEGLPYSRDDIEEMIGKLQEREAKAAELIEAAVKQQEFGGASSASAQSAGGIAVRKSEYSIQEVFGSGGGMTARLQDSEGNPHTVTVGDQLPDGSTVVVVQINSVAIAKDNKQTMLDWAGAETVY